jgi:REP element-mobilizing transposase RayT
MNKQHIPLLPSNFYHLFNRAVGNEKLFREDENYRYCLAKMKQHILPVADLFAYSLLPNHFHLLVRVKPEERIRDFFEVKKGNPFDEKANDLSDFIMEQFSNWLNGYTKAFNKMYDRKGGLFIDYMKRTEAETDSDVTSFIFYIHKNAVHHGLKKRIGEWLFDSYAAILSEKPTALMRNEMIEWFGSKQSFIDFHNQPVNLKIKNIDLL